MNDWRRRATAVALMGRMPCAHENDEPRAVGVFGCCLEHLWAVVHAGHNGLRYKKHSETRLAAAASWPFGRAAPLGRFWGGDLLYDSEHWGDRYGNGRPT